MFIGYNKSTSNFVQFPKSVNKGNLVDYLLENHYAMNVLDVSSWVFFETKGGFSYEVQYDFKEYEEPDFED